MIISANIKTGSKKGPLVEVQKNNEIIVYLRSHPHDGEANAELIKLLSKHFHIAKTRINIKTGAKSHRKKIEII